MHTPAVAEYVALHTILLTHPKADRLSDRAWRTLTLAWCYAGQHETGGYIPAGAERFIRANARTLDELEVGGWIHRNGGGWVLHDWDDAQAALVRHERKRKADRDRQRINRTAADL